MTFNDWQTHKLGDLVESISVKHKFDKSQLIFLNTSDILKGQILHNNYSDINTFPGQAKKSIKKGDILFSEIRPKNKRFALINFEAEDYVVSTKLMVLRRKNEMIDNKYLYLFLTSDQTINYLQSIAEGRSGTFPQITYKELKGIDINLPDIKEQRAIANILSNLDEKIETNNQINEKLEEMAQALFKHWFIDFEFPNENGEPYKSSGGEMVESELGMIPKEWEIKKISELCNVKDGTHDSPKGTEEGYPLITSKHLKGTSLDFENTKNISEDDYDQINRRSKVHRYDILISMIGTVGNIYLVQDEKIEFAIKNVGLIKTSELMGLYEYIYCHLKSKIIEQYIKERTTGSTQQYISLKSLREIPILIPNQANLLTMFNKLASKHFDSIYTNVKINQKLESIRNIIVPKLMSGEIPVMMVDNNSLDKS